MRLVYRMDYSGMYNNVSQVVYFHYPQYQQQAQVPLELALECAVHTLPMVMQLMPDVLVVYDDDDVLPGLTLGAAAPFTWLVSCASVFLIDARCSFSLISACAAC